MCLYNVADRGVMSCVSILSRGGCHAMCLYNVTDRGVMSWVSLL